MLLIYLFKKKTLFCYNYITNNTIKFTKLNLTYFLITFNIIIIIIIFFFYINKFSKRKINKYDRKTLI